MRRMAQALILITLHMVFLQSQSLVTWANQEDWSVNRANAQNTGSTISEGPTGPGLSIKWSFSINKNRLGSGVPIVSKGLILIGADKLYAVDEETGQLKWSYRMGGIGMTSPPIADGTTVYICGIMAAKTMVQAIDLGTGNRKWMCIFGQQPGEMITAAPTVDNGMLYAASNDGIIYAITTNKGIRKWMKHIGPRSGDYSTPAIDRGIIYVCSPDHNLYALYEKN